MTDAAHPSMLDWVVVVVFVCVPLLGTIVALQLQSLRDRGRRGRKLTKPASQIDLRRRPW